MAVSVRQQRYRLAHAQRARGQSWVEIAEALGERWPELTARAALRLAHTKAGRCWTQRDAADEWAQRFPDERAPEPKELSRWEIWPQAGGVRPSFDTLDKMALVYECAISDLLVDVSDYRYRDSANRPRVAATPLAQPRERPEAGDESAYDAGSGSPQADQFDGYRTAGVLTAMAMPPGLRQLLEAPGKASEEGVLLVNAAIGDLEARDALRGGGAALQMAMTLHDLVAKWLNDPRRTLETALQAAYCDLGALIGWSAYDAGQPAIARRYVNDTLALARFVAASGAEHRAMNTLCLLLSDSGRPGEALQCARQAQRSASVHGQRTVALFHIRAARTNAKLGDVGAFRRELARAEEAFVEAAEDVGPSWVQFLDKSEFASVEGGSYLLLGQVDQAIAAYRTAVGEPGLRGARNAISRTVWLAEAHLRAGDVSEACRTASEVLRPVATLSSGRVARRLHRFRRAIEPQTLSSPLAADFADAYEQTFPPMSGLSSAM